MVKNFTTEGQAIKCNERFKHNPRLQQQITT